MGSTVPIFHNHTAECTLVIIITIFIVYYNLMAYKQTMFT